MYPKLRKGILALVILAIWYLKYGSGELLKAGRLKEGFAVWTARQWSGYWSARARHMLKPLTSH